MSFDTSTIEDPALKTGIEEYLKTQEESLKTSITEQVKTELGKDVEALQGNNRKLLDEKKAEEDKRKALQAIFGDRDPEEVGRMLKQFESDEDAALLQSGKLDEFKARIQEREKAASDARIDTEATARAEAEKQAAAFKAQIHDLTIGSEVKQEFVANGGLSDVKAQEYAAIEAARWWRITDDGKQECRDPATNELVKGKAGLITMSEWVQEKLRSDAPILFTKPEGSGASGGAPAPTNTKPLKEWTAAEMGAYAAQHGDEALIKLQQ